GHHADGAAVDAADAGDDAVSRQVTGHGVGQQGVLDPRTLVEQQGEPIADEQLVLAGQLLPLAFEVALQGPVAGAGDVHRQPEPYVRRLARMATSSRSGPLAASRADCSRPLRRE